MSGKTNTQYYPIDEVHYDIIQQLCGRVDHVIKQIFSYLDHKEIAKAEMVSKSWREIITSLQIWETFTKSKIAKFPLWKRISHLLESDEASNPEERSLSAKQITKAVFESCQILENSWSEPFLNFYGGVQKMHMSFEGADSNPSHHLQTDDNYIALKDLKGCVQVWSRKSGCLELQSEPEAKYGNGTYTIGDKLVICSGLDGVIKVWDMTTSKICFELQDLKGSQIMSLKYNPDFGVLIACSKMLKLQKLQSHPLLTVWKTDKRGHFSLKYQQEMTELIAFRLLGWEAETFGIVGSVHSSKHIQVRIYTHNEPFNLVTSIDLGERHRLDWADGYLALCHNDKLELYDVTTGACLDSWDSSVINGNVYRQRFSIECHQVELCSTHIVTVNVYNGHYFIWAWKFASGFFDPTRKNSVSLKLLNPGGFFFQLLPDDRFIMELVEVNEFQIVVMIYPFKPLGYEIGENHVSTYIQLLNIYPPCTSCGLYKRDTKPEVYVKYVEFCSRECQIKSEGSDSLCKCFCCNEPNPLCKSGCCIDPGWSCKSDCLGNRELSCNCRCCGEPHPLCKSGCCIEPKPSCHCGCWIN